MQVRQAYLRWHVCLHGLVKPQGREQPPSAASELKSSAVCTSMASCGCFLQQSGRASDTSDALSSSPMTPLHILVCLVCLKVSALPTSTMPCMALHHCTSLSRTLWAYLHA